MLAFRGPETKAVVWEHNSHIGDAAATEMGARGELERRAARAHHVRRRRLSGRLRNRPRHGGGGERLGRADGGEGGAAGAPAELRAALPRRVGRRVSAAAAPAAAQQRCATSWRPLVSSAPSGWCTGRTRSCQPLFQAVLPRAVRRVHLVRRVARGDAARPRQTRGAPDTYPFGLSAAAMSKDAPDGARLRGSEPARRLTEIAAVRSRLHWMREQQIWPNGLRYLWTDAFGVVLLVSLFRASATRATSPKPCGWSARSSACSAGDGAFASARSPTATASTSTTWRCGSMRCTDSGP